MKINFRPVPGGNRGGRSREVMKEEELGWNGAGTRRQSTVGEISEARRYDRDLTECVWAEERVGSVLEARWRRVAAETSLN